MLDPRETITSLFVTLKKEPYILIRIEFLVIVISGIFLAMFIMDFRRNRSHSAVRKTILKILDGVSDSMVVYTLGAMQAAQFRNQLFPVWAMVVVSFASSIDYISGYERTSRLSNGQVMRPLGLAFLNSRRGSKLKVQLWTLWAVMLLRSLYRFLARNMSIKSWWNGHSVDLVTEYMRGDHENTNLRLDACNPLTMEGYAYLVYGETMQRIELGKPRYILYLCITKPCLLVTLDKIWQCDGRLLRSSDSRGEHLKDMCLAFSLSGILRCRLEDATLHPDSLFMTRNLVRSKILMKSANRAFRILELELTFLNDALHTRYPIVFWRGLTSLFLSLTVSLLTFAVAFWLAVDIRRIYKPPEGDLVHIVRGANVDVIITWVLMVFMMFKEAWEMVTYLLSDWTRLLLVCKYVQWSNSGWKWKRGCMRNSLTEKLIWSFFTSKIGGRWHGIMDQYELLRSFDYIPSIWNAAHRATLGLVERKNDGAKLSADIKVPECVKSAIMRTLRSSIELAKDGPLQSQISTLSSSDMMDRFGWACKLTRCSQVILVWHIATSLCEINLALKHEVDLSNPGFLRSTLTWLTSFCPCTSQPPYLMDHSILDDKIKTNYQIANSLSRYCAYLVAFQPEMLPDSFLLPDLIFEATVQDCRSIVQDADSLDERYEKLIEEAARETTQADTIKSSGNIVQQAAILGLDLINIDRPELRWKILAGMWVDLVVHIAPTWNTAAHKRRLESGGEFLTYIWALLCHFGIEKSTLWSGDQAS